MGIVVFVIPYVFWAGITELFAERFLRYFLVDRTHDRFLPRLLQERFLPRNYFRGPNSYPSHLWWRTLQLLFFVFFLCALTVPRLPVLTPATPTNEAAEFGLFGLVYLLLLGPLLGFAWLYEDWGIRGYDETRRIAYPLGSTLVRYITGFGALGTFVRFVTSIGTNQAEIAASVTFLLLLLLPPCLIVTWGFHGIREPELVGKFAEGEISRMIPLRTLKIE